MNRDGHTDLIFSNYEYLAIIDGHTTSLLWHYVRNGSIREFVIGYFDAPSSKDSMDVAAYSGTSLYVLSDDQQPQAPPLPALAEASLESRIAQLITSSAIIGLPVIAMVSLFILDVRRKRETR
jgi:hypothetical protein